MVLVTAFQINHNFVADKFESSNEAQVLKKNEESRDVASNDNWKMLKQQQNDVKPIVLASTISENVTSNINKPQSVITEQQDLPEMMEKLLRAQPADYTADNVPIPPTQHEQFRKINVEDMFKVDTNNLPQPPPNWRNKIAPPSGGLPEWTANVPPPVPTVNSIPTGHARPIKGAGKSKGNDNLFYSGGSGVTPPKSNDGIYHPQPMNMYPQMISRQPLGPPPPQQTKTFYQVSSTHQTTNDIVIIFQICCLVVSMAGSKWSTKS